MTLNVKSELLQISTWGQIELQYILVVEVKVVAGGKLILENMTAEKHKMRLKMALIHHWRNKMCYILLQTRFLLSNIEAVNILKHDRVCSQWFSRGKCIQSPLFLTVVTYEWRHKKTERRTIQAKITFIRRYGREIGESLERGN
jgi:hypothetical protein